MNLLDGVTIGEAILGSVWAICGTAILLTILRGIGTFFNG